MLSLFVLTPLVNSSALIKASLVSQSVPAAGCPRVDVADVSACCVTGGFGGALDQIVEAVVSALIHSMSGE
jgi:hypothetical protein